MNWQTYKTKMSGDDKKTITTKNLSQFIGNDIPAPLCWKKVGVCNIMKRDVMYRFARRAEDTWVLWEKAPVKPCKRFGTYKPEKSK